ncbi:MAG: hypothetical protein WBZ36_24225, partial [Candidatus Nitrosopolaris sp.]
SGRVPKIDLNTGRSQGLFHSYCFKIFASEDSLDNSKAKGLLDRSFEVLCLVGKPEHNIKEVSDECNRYLRNELLKTRKLLFACRMLHNKDIIDDVNLNVFNREAELTKPLVRLFQNSPEVLKELLPALSKCLDAKRKVKSNSLEAILYTAIGNLTPVHGFAITNQSIEDEVKRITGGVDIPGQQAFYSQDLGKMTFRQITDTLVSKFKATNITTGRGNERKRGKQFTQENLKRKGIEYDVPDKIEILSVKNAPSGPDIFDRILLGAGGEEVGTVGTVGTLSGGVDVENHTQNIVDGGTRGEDDGRIREEEHGTEGAIKTENSSTHPLEPFPAFPTFPTFPMLPMSTFPMLPDGTSTTSEENQGKYIASDFVKSKENQEVHSQPEKDPGTPPPLDEPKLPNLPEMSEELEDDLDMVSEKELPVQEPSKESNPIISIEDFFRDDVPLPSHSVEESPCFHIITTKSGEIPTETVYYCKLHPELGSTFLSQIELHCIQKEPEHHKAAILASLQEGGSV